jgi:protein TonB
MKVESRVKASTATVTGRSTPMQSVQALSEQAVPMTDVQPAPEKPETTQAAPAQIASLQPVTATEVADASDVTPAAEPGIPAPRVRPPQPNDGKIVASSTRRKAEKPAPQKKRKVAQKRRSAAKGKQSSTQRSAQNNSGKSSHNASRGGGSGSKQKAAGNAKASNYPGLVYRKIQRTRQKRAGGRGSVRIRFSVSSSGGLARISIAKSSGSKKIDQAALAHIRRAAPFPAPPKGARRSFTIPVDIRG